jgi:nitrogen fixation protein NifU and related proteins
MYTDKVLEHFKSPRNQGVIKNASGVGEVGNPVCGDIMKIYIKVGEDKKGKEVIDDIKFETLGCGAAIATSSILTELAKGKDLKSAKKIDKDDIVKELGGLPDAKIHCSILAHQGLRKAIDDYMGKK